MEKAPISRVQCTFAGRYPAEVERRRVPGHWVTCYRIRHLTSQSAGSRHWAVLGSPGRELDDKGKPKEACGVERDVGYCIETVILTVTTAVVSTRTRQERAGGHPTRAAPRATTTAHDVRLRRQRHPPPGGFCDTVKPWGGGGRPDLAQISARLEHVARSDARM